MKKVPIRLKLAAAFAFAMVVVLSGAGWFVYGRLRADLDESVNLSLQSRWEAADRWVGSDLGSFPLEEPDESFVQLLDEQRIVSSAGVVAAPVLVNGEFDSARSQMLLVERPVSGIEGVTRILAGPRDQGVLVVGLTMANRDEALRDVMLSFAIGTPVAVLVASLIGYVLASAGMAPVDAMSVAATEISEAGTGRRLPVPEARDEIATLAETLNQMMDRLDQSAMRERRFVADAAHELRTPIAIARTELEALALTGVEPEAVASALDELERLTQLTEDLLVMAQVSETGLALSLQPASVQSMLEAVRSRFSARAKWQGRRIDIENSVAEPVEVDSHRVAQALSNLVDNALRHGKGDIAVKANLDGTVLLLEVVDGGDGFDASFVDRAFERFSRADAARARGGAGLGLAIVQALAEAHRGTVSIVSGEKTTVAIRLPV